MGPKILIIKKKLNFNILNSLFLIYIYIKINQKSLFLERPYKNIVIYSEFICFLGKFYFSISLF